MTDMMTVTHLTHNSNRKPFPNKTMDTILRDVFGDKLDTETGTRPQVGLVRFRAITQRGWYEGPLRGIQISDGDYSATVHRRVMVTKDGKIDRDALRAKTAEVESAAERAQMARNTEAAIMRAEDNLVESVKAAVSYPTEWTRLWLDAPWLDAPWLDAPVTIERASPDTVKVIGRTVTGRQLVELEKIAGEQKVRVELVLGKEQAIEAYRVLTAGVEVGVEKTGLFRD